MYIEGRIQTRSWDDASTGQKRYMTEIVANEMIMLDPPSGGGARRSSARPTEQAAGTVGSTSFRRRTTTMTFRSDRRAARAARATDTLALADSVCCARVVARPGRNPIPALLEPDFLLSVGEVVDPATWRDAERIVGTAGETMIMDRSNAQYDLVYVPSVVEGRSLSPGDAVQLFRLDRRIYDPATREPLGRLLLPTGIGIVDSLAGETARVRVSDAFHPILVGDGVRIVTDAMETWPAAVSQAGGAGGSSRSRRRRRYIRRSIACS